MKTIKKNVYYCDFCKKKGLSAPAISKHEKHCTSNPNRDCGLCHQKIDYIGIAEKLKARYKIENEYLEIIDYWSDRVIWTDKPIIIDELFDLMEGCPACVLTVMKLAGLTKYIFQSELPFNYSKEREEWWAEINRELRRQDEESTMYY